MSRLQNNIKPTASGRYVVAVSGGIDSMVLLDFLRRQNNLELVAAHVDHGIRFDSYKDCELVAEYARKHNLKFEFIKLGLGVDASEEAARERRYNFLHQCCKKHNARLITAHHQEDLIETAIIALVRGTGWRGLAPFTGQETLRPLLNATKADILSYARKNSVVWREDSTNQDERYLRNYIRLSLMPMLDQKSDTWREDFLQKIRMQQTLRKNIEQDLQNLIFVFAKKNALTLPRYYVIMTPSEVAYEFMQELFRQHLSTTVLRSLAETAVMFVKTARQNKILQLNKDWQIRVLKSDFVVEKRRHMLTYSKQ